MAYVRQHPNPDYPMYRIKVGVMPDFSGANYIDQEKPSGIMDGKNRVFRLKYQPIRNSEDLYKDGMKMKRASSLAFTDGDYYLDYQSNPATITFSEKQVPQQKSVIIVSYKTMYEGS